MMRNDDKITGMLDGAVGYLSGSIEFAKDGGIGWRRQFIDLVTKANLKIDCIDPTNKPGETNYHVTESKNYQTWLQKEGRFKELQDYVSAYRRFDLRYVDVSDFLVAVVDPAIPQLGTANEIYVAEQQHKPTFFVCEGGLSTLPRWLFDLVDLPFSGRRCNVFTSIEQVIEELVQLDLGQIAMSNEWVLVRKHIENTRKN